MLELLFPGLLLFTLLQSEKDAGGQSSHVVDMVIDEMTDTVLQIYIPAFEILSAVYDELDDPSMMVSPTQLANQLLDWTDPRKAV